MVKVLQIGMTDNMGGIENYLINYYRNIDREVIQFDFINIYHNKLCFQDEIEKMGGKVYKVSNYYKHPLKYIKEMIKIIKENNYRIIHCNMNSAVMLYPLIAAKLSKAKVIIAHSHNSSSDKGIAKSLLHSINKHFIPLFATDYFACSDLAGKWFFSKKIIKSSSFKIINNSIDVNKFKFNNNIRQQKRKELNIQENCCAIGHVGRFVKQKNQIFLLEVFNEYLKQNNNAKLIFIGIGEEQEKVKEIARGLNIMSKVLFLDSRSDVNELMQAMDIFILPSLYEGFPMVGVEAQASNLSCIFSNNITNKILLNQNSYQLSLKENLNIWCNVIEKIRKENTDRNEKNEKILEYDSYLNALKLKEWYLKKNKIKICHFVNGMQNGGVENFIYNYFCNMKNQKDYDLNIITQGKGDENCMKQFKDLGFKIFTVTKKRESLIRNYKEIMGILKNENFEIVHAHMTTTNFFPLIYAKFSHVPVRISHSHLCNTAIPIKEKIYIFLTRLVSQYKFACSTDAGHYLFGKSKKIKIINNAIDAQKFSYNEEIRKTKRMELKIDEDDIVIGHVGRFVEQKNHEFIIKLFERMYRNNKRYKLVLIGTGELEEKIKTMVRNKGLENNVIFLESRSDVNELMQVMDIFILPSLYEGLGIVLVEAQCAGLPCLGSSYIPKDIILTNYIKLLKLDLDIWEEEIKSIDCSKHRENNIKSISNKGYDIKIEANKLDKLYKKMLRKEKI